ncbi:uncharacterized protein FIESC28_08074 [Fusarium coffeatum]|uniref:Uncharacterized protein n=1 Tax=Fusarium coffeatum TaxID=231269 RepID=A0A366R988_9HYPO|nr:uncharacterized protein FIESC28_08074 [Fusarium coffeatum]RBR13714.1 hypothetical protein FIESC28_08074 [Fusarium coffeatum]
MDPSAVEYWLENLMERIESESEMGDISIQMLDDEYGIDLPLRRYTNDRIGPSVSRLEETTYAEYVAFLGWRLKGYNAVRLELYLKKLGPDISSTSGDEDSSDDRELSQSPPDHERPTLYKRRKRTSISILDATKLDWVRKLVKERYKKVTRPVKRREDEVFDLYIKVLELDSDSEPHSTREVPQTFKDFVFLKDRD